MGNACDYMRWRTNKRRERTREKERKYMCQNTSIRKQETPARLASSRLEE
jgi:hypothetical protein